MRITTRQLKRIIAEEIGQVLEFLTYAQKAKGEEFKNPETGKMIKVGTGLGYPKGSRVYRAAKKVYDSNVKFGDRQAKKKAREEEFENPERPGDFIKISAGLRSPKGSKKYQAAKKQHDRYTRNHFPYLKS